MKKFFAFFLVLLCLISMQTVTVWANDGFANVDAFGDLLEPGLYMAEEYRGNYSLDTEELGIMDAVPGMGKFISNLLFDCLSMVAFVTCSIFYYCFELDFAALLSPQIDAMQGMLKTGIFDALFAVAFGGAALYVFLCVLRRNITEAAMQLLKVVLIVATSYFVVTNSSTAITLATGITREISSSAISAMAGQEESGDTGEYAAVAAGNLWGSLVHQPWLVMQFGTTDVNLTTVEKFLTSTPDSTERKDLVDTYIESNPAAFDKDVSGERIGYILLLLVPVLAKCVVFMGLGVLQLGLQLLSIFYIFLAPVFLLMAMVPSLGGTTLISTWLKKILETQVSVLLLNYFIGLIIWMDNTTFSWADEIGFLTVVFLQVGILIVLVLMREKIFGFFSTITKSVQSPGYAASRLSHTGDVFGGMDGQARKENRTQQKHRKSAQLASKMQQSGTKEKPSVLDYYVPRSGGVSKQSQTSGNAIAFSSLQSRKVEKVTQPVNKQPALILHTPPISEAKPLQEVRTPAQLAAILPNRRLTKSSVNVAPQEMAQAQQELHRPRLVQSTMKSHQESPKTNLHQSPPVMAARRKEMKAPEYHSPMKQSASTAKPSLQPSSFPKDQAPPEGPILHNNDVPKVIKRPVMQNYAAPPLEKQPVNSGNGNATINTPTGVKSVNRANFEASKMSTDIPAPSVGGSIHKAPIKRPTFEKIAPAPTLPCGIPELKPPRSIPPSPPRKAEDKKRQAKGKRTLTIHRDIVMNRVG